jgi:hypothetical protein
MIARFFSLGMVGLLMGGSAWAQVFFSGSTVTIDFDTTVLGVNNGPFEGSGFARTPSPGQLDSQAWAVKGLSDGDLAFGATGTSGDFARGKKAGSVTTGGIYAFEVGGSTDVGLGFQPGGTDLTPGSITLRIRNDTGGVLNALQVAYDLYCYNDKARTTSMKLGYSTDDTIYVAVPALDYTTPGAADVNPTWQATSFSTTLSGLKVNDGGYLYLRWSTDDVNTGATGYRDELALDNITFTPMVGVPEPAAGLAGTVALLGFALLRRRRRGDGMRGGS